MSLGKHTRNVDGRLRKERSDSKLVNLKEEYPELAKFNGNRHLGSVEKELGVDSLSQVLKALRTNK